MNNGAFSVQGSGLGRIFSVSGGHVEFEESSEMQATSGPKTDRVQKLFITLRRIKSKSEAKTRLTSFFLISVAVSNVCVAWSSDLAD